MPGAKLARGFVRKKTHEGRHHRFAGRFRHSPRDGVTAYFELSLEIGLSVSIPAVMRQHHRPVNASVEASGPHDFAVRLLAHSS
jgi:hypothetical protein